MHKKYIVLDDDPTGIQSVHDINVITVLDLNLIEEAFLSRDTMFYILTNSRAFSQEKTITYHKKLMEMLIRVSEKTKTPFTVISRSDSTLRGHYPLETEVIFHCLKKHNQLLDGEILCPYLKDIRKTVDDIHYVLVDNHWIKVGDSEFAKDKSFSFRSSDLKEYVEEKTSGRYSADQCISISLNMIREQNIDKIVQLLDSVSGFNKVIVNAENMEDLLVFVKAYEQSTKKFLFRCAASLVKCLGHIEDRPFLTKEECVDETSKGGIIIVGSHVKNTTQQLQYLMKHSPEIEYIEFDQHRILDGSLNEESVRVSKLVNERIKENKIVIVATRRDRVDYPSDDEEKQLDWANQISHHLVKVLSYLQQRPKFIVTKGGITGNDALVQGLHVRKEKVLGQIITNVGVVLCLEGSKFEKLPVVVFPGNVGSEDSLHEVVEKLR